MDNARDKSAEPIALEIRLYHSSVKRSISPVYGRKKARAPAIIAPIDNIVMTKKDVRRNLIDAQMSSHLL